MATLFWRLKCPDVGFSFGFTSPLRTSNSGPLRNSGRPQWQDVYMERGTYYIYICICMVRFSFVCSQCALTTWDHPSSLSRKPKLRRSSLCLTTFFWSQPPCVLRIHPATQAWQSNCFLNKIWKQNNIVPIFMDSTSPTILGPIAIHQELSHLVLVSSLVGF